MIGEKVTILAAGLGLLAMALVQWSPCLAAEGFFQALGPREFQFPEDHGHHPGFQTEWWYYTGNLTSKDGRPFGFQLTFFRVQLKPEPFLAGSPWRSNQVYFAHLTISNLQDGEFLTAEKVGRGKMGIGGVSLDSQRVRVFLHGWETVIQEDVHDLKADGDDFAIDLQLVSQKRPVLHGKKGLSRKGGGPGQASYYYTLSRLKSQGVLTLHDERLKVSGFSWMDHEFSSNVLSKDQAGWDWMGLQLSHNRELMLYVLRHRDGSVAPYSSGTLIQSDGTPVHLPKETFVVRPVDFWVSKQSQTRYPSGWHVEVLPYRMNLTVTPNMKNQELITSQSTQVTYWEGSVRVTGAAARERVMGSGYVELTGYSGEFELGF
jgi:predicted secreted hydrolase